MTLDLERPLLTAADDVLTSPNETAAAIRESSLNRLTTLLRIADGAWALAIYASATVRSQMIEELTARLAPLPVVELSLAAGPVQLFDYLRQLPADAPPLALMCHSYGDGLSPLLRSLDLQRDALARLPHRLVFWVNSYERRQFLEQAPNFTSRLGGTFRFPGAGPGSAPVTTAGMLQQVTSDSSNSAVRRRPYLAVRNARHREEQISYLRQRIHDLQQMARRDDEAIGDAWYDLAGLLESGEPRRWADAEAAYAEAARAYACAGRSLAEAEARYRAGDAARRAYESAAALEHFARALHLFRVLVDTPATTPEAVAGEANVLKAQGDVLAFLDQREEALARYDQALALFRTVGARLGEANVLQAQGDVLAFLDQREEALARYDQALALFRTVGARLGEANVLKAQGDVLAFLDQREEALARYDQALALFRTVGARLGEANVLQAQGDVHRLARMFAAAHAAYDDALRLYRQTGSRQGEANVYLGLARTTLAEGNGAEAQSWAERAIALHTANQSRFDVALDCETLAMACKDAGDFEGGIAALRKAAQLYTDIGLVERANHVRTRLGSWLDEAERLDESVSVYLDAVQLQPDAVGRRPDWDEARDILDWGDANAAT
jgi:tetratricopeptide (TPR) repeat protein